jgi:predicted transcriptional regulator
MDIVYKYGEVTSQQVLKNMTDPPTIHAIRRFMKILEEKGYLRHKWEGPKHVYFPILNRKKASEAAIDHLKDTFFNGSVAHAMTALFKHSESELSDEELEAFSMLIENARKRGK